MMMKIILYGRISKLIADEDHETGLDGSFQVQFKTQDGVLLQELNKARRKPVRITIEQDIPNVPSNIRNIKNKK